MIWQYYENWRVPGINTFNACNILSEDTHVEITILVQQRLINRWYTSLINCGSADSKLGHGTYQLKILNITFD